jgi:hypothetical protein
MIELLDEWQGSAAERAQFVAAAAERVAAALASAGKGDATQVAAAEAEVAADPQRAIRVHSDGSATVVAAGRRYQGGRFEVPRICELRARALAARAAAGRPQARRRLWIFDGPSAATDIGTLQAWAPPGTLFQVASQFNCLEAPGAFVTPVHRYLHDPTQGPRASISAFPGTLVRHYAAPSPEGGRFVQRNDGAQVNLLAEVCAPGVAMVRNGYLRSTDIVDPAAFARAVEERFEGIAVGVHDGVEVVLGHDWEGGVPAAPHRTVAQVLTSTVAGGMYSEISGDAAGALICQQLQRAAYLGTLLAAAALGKRRVVLTLIGGGVFDNPMATIFSALVWAADQVEAALHDDLSIIVNGRTLGQELPAETLRAAARARGGEVIRFDSVGAGFAER